MNKCPICKSTLFHVDGLGSDFITVRCWKKDCWTETYEIVSKKEK